MAIVYFRFGGRPTDEPRRAALLEQSLCRADAPRRIGDWRAHALSLAAPGVPAPSVAGALQTLSLEPLGDGGRLYVASPVHLVAGLHGVSLARDGLLELDAAELERLAGDFNALFGGSGMRLVRTRERELLCLLEDAKAPLAATTDPAQVLGEDIREHLPAGPAGAPLRRLMSELEMWLHAHALNEQRRARALPEVSSLWLWGGGIVGEPLPSLDLWSHGADPLFRRYAPQDRYPGAQRSGVVVCTRAPGEAGWPEFERAWLAPALKDLRAGRLERIELSAGDRSRALRPTGAYRFWRRAQPWWDALEVGNS